MSTDAPYDESSPGGDGEGGECASVRRRVIDRRSFLKSAGVAAVALGVPSVFGGMAATVSPSGQRPLSRPMVPFGQIGGPDWDVMADTWAATDALGRAVPTAEKVGPPRPDRFVGLFYFLWLGQGGPGGTNGDPGPYDITKILAADPQARYQENNPLWGPVGDYHFWSEPYFGYYVSTDPWVYRKHACMLADAGVDTLIFDTSNGSTFPQCFTVLLDAFAEVRRDGGTTPQVAFLAPFGYANEYANPGYIVERIYDQLYKPNLHPELWFRWEGKPLVLADPNLIGITQLITIGGAPNPSQLFPGHTQGQTFTATEPLVAVGAEVPTFTTTTSSFTFSLYSGGPGGTLIATEHFTDVQDESTPLIILSTPAPPGVYYLEQSDVSGMIGWWSNPDGVYSGGEAYYDSEPTPQSLITIGGAPNPSQLLTGHTQGQTFTATEPLVAVGAEVPTFTTTTSSFTFSLYSGGPGGTLIATEHFTDVQDESTPLIILSTPAPPGVYYLEQSDVSGMIGWWSNPDGVYSGGEAYYDSEATPGDRNLLVAYTTGGVGDRNLSVRYYSERTEEILGFFTFRAPQPSYFTGQTGPEQWGWLETYPQGVFTNSAGEPEELPVGVAQNAVNGVLGAMSEKGAEGRSYHDGQQPTGEEAPYGFYPETPYGLNLQEQWERALAVDPEFVFVTGWNEWVAARLTSFNGVSAPVVFVDEFDWEHSRDIEPMRGGFGDDYYYQLVANVRRYKGARALPPASPPTRIEIDGHFGDWAAVAPDYRDHVGDTMHRNHAGWGSAGPYVNITGRNDIVLSKVARDAENVYFYARCRDDITPFTSPNWMMLFIGIVGSVVPGWEGFQFVVNRRVKNQRRTYVEAATDGWNWRTVGEALYAVAGSELEVRLPRQLLGLSQESASFELQFKWIDNVDLAGDIMKVISDGDAAPSGRFKFRYQASFPHQGGGEVLG